MARGRSKQALRALRKRYGLGEFSSSRRRRRKPARRVRSNSRRKPVRSARSRRKPLISKGLYDWPWS